MFGLIFEGECSLVFWFVWSSDGEFDALLLWFEDWYFAKFGAIGSHDAVYSLVGVALGFLLGAEELHSDSVHAYSPLLVESGWFAVGLDGGG